MRHRHFDLIVKWASDPSIKIEFYDSHVEKWRGIPNLSWNEGIDYRIAPKKIVTRFEWVPIKKSMFQRHIDRWELKTIVEEIE